MKSNFKKLVALVGMMAIAVSTMRAQDSGALVDALVKKGVLTDQEAEEIRADLAKEYATTSAGKLNISNHITQLTLYGDARWRYEYDSTRSQSGISGTNTSQINAEQWRPRYRIRVGADYKFTDNFNAGFELESATANDSANQTVGAGFEKFSINVGLLYVTYKPEDFVTLTGGKMKNPLYTTDMLWDPDINPEGAAEMFTWAVNDQFNVGLTAVEFIYADNNESNSTTNTYNPTTGVGTNQNSAQDSWIFAAQVPATYKFTKAISATIAPGFYTRTGGSTSTWVSSGATPNTGAPVLASAEANSYLNQIAAPGDVTFKLFNQKAKFYWDFVFNASGEDRIKNVYGINNGQNMDLRDDIAWLAGFQLGDNKKKGDWLVGIDFRQTGLASVDPNLSDSDFGDGYLNQQGIKVRTGYNFTDFLTGNITYYDTWNYKSSLGNATVNGANINGINSSSRLDFDLNWKF
jgi:polyhydroxyalkanoate synthesis regulator phasin